MDGRDAVGTPWESEGPNSPVFVKKFVEYDDMPFILADNPEGGFPKVFRMRPSNSAAFGYTLEEANGSIIPDALFKSFEISEKEAVELL